MEHLNTEPNREPKKEQKRRRSALPGLMKELLQVYYQALTKVEKIAGDDRAKMSQLHAQIEEAQRLEAARNKKDDIRLRAILNTVTAGAVERLVKASGVLTESDREFLREKSWRV